MKTIKAACIQMKISDCKKEENISKALLMASEAVLQGAEIIVFPEVFATGFCYSNMEDSAEYENGNIMGRMRSFSYKNNCVLLFSFIEKVIIEGNAEYYNLGVCIEDGEIAGKYRKTHLFKREKQYFCPGKSIVPVLLTKRKLTVGLQICYELRFPEIARKLTLEGADILVTIAQFPSPREHIWRSLVIARAIENQIPHIACNRVGKEYDTSYFGGSVIVDSLGEVQADAEGTDSVIFSVIDFEKTRQSRQSITVFEDRHPGLY